MKRGIITVAFVLGLTGAAQAQSIADQVVSQLQAEGYDRIEVKNGLSQVKVEAIRNGRQLEIVYDSATGAILKQEVEPVDRNDDTAPGVQIRTENRDFVRTTRSDRGGRADRDDDDDRRGGGGRADRDDDDDRRDRGSRADRDDDDDDDDRRGRGGRSGRDDDDRGRDRDDDDDDNDDDDDD